MSNKTILHIAISTPLRQTFDYILPSKLSDTNIRPGARALVPFGKKEVIGIVIAITAESKVTSSKLKEVLELIDKEPLLPPSILDLINWTSNYYHHPIGDVINNVLPSLLRQKPSTRKSKISQNAQKAPSSAKQKNLQLNSAQQHAVDTIKKQLNSFTTFLLDGVTGSGKTEVYLRVIADILKQNKLFQVKT